MTDSFYHAEHATMVFPRYDMNLRQVLKKYGRGVGIKLDALRVYAAQLLTALRQLRHLGIVHVSFGFSWLFLSAGCPCSCARFFRVPII